MFIAIKNVYGAITIVGCLSLLPTALAIAVFWMMKFAEKASDPNKLARLSILFFKICAIAQLALIAVYAIVFLIGAVVFFRLGIAPIAILIILADAGYVYLLGSYFFKYFLMARGAEETLATGENRLYVYKYVVVINWILGISSILTFSSLAAFLSGLLNGVSIILFTLCFQDYKKELPLAAAVVKGFKSSDAIAVAPSAPRQANHGAYQPQRNSGKTRTYATQLTSENVVDIFENDISSLDRRYASVFSTETTSEGEVSISNVSIVKDKVNDDQFLRLGVKLEKNQYGLTPSSITLAIELYDNYNRALATGEVEYAIVDNNIALYAIKIPEGVTNGSLVIKSIKYTEGMNKEMGISTGFYTDEKNQFDIDTFVNMGGVR